MNIYVYDPENTSAIYCGHGDDCQSYVLANGENIKTAVCGLQVAEALRKGTGTVANPGDLPENGPVASEVRDALDSPGQHRLGKAIRKLLDRTPSDFDTYHVGPGEVLTR